jgi:hypothetical protein
VISSTPELVATAVTGVVALGATLYAAVLDRRTRRLGRRQTDTEDTLGARATGQTVPERAVLLDCECGVPGRRCQIAGH